MYQQELAILSAGDRRKADGRTPAGLRLIVRDQDIDVICSDWPLWRAGEEWRTSASDGIWQRMMPAGVTWTGGRFWAHMLPIWRGQRPARGQPTPGIAFDPERRAGMRRNGPF